MAIKVNGTTVIDDSRNVQNVGGFRTVNGTSVVGSGDISAGASTTYGAVGTYIIAYRAAGPVTISKGSTYSGSGMRRWTSGNLQGDTQRNVNPSSVSSLGVGGTWRAMSTGYASSSSYVGPAALYVRIS